MSDVLEEFKDGGSLSHYNPDGVRLKKILEMVIVCIHSSSIPIGNRFCRLQDLYGPLPGSLYPRRSVQASLPELCKIATTCQHRWKNTQGMATLLKKTASKKTPQDLFKKDTSSLLHKNRGEIRALLLEKSKTVVPFLL